MDASFGMLIGMLFGIAVMSLVGAVILRAAAKWVEKLDVPFGNAYVTMLLAAIVNGLLGFVIGLAVGAGTQSREAVNAASLLMWPIGFCIQSGFVSSRIQIPFGRACLVSLTMMGIGLAIGLIAVVPALLIMKFMM